MGPGIGNKWVGVDVVMGINRDVERGTGPCAGVGVSMDGGNGSVSMPYPR